uniref:Uncharacterized protein n=1 Tax=Oryza rufipogon TaxID=4529 RepID=A0A0E0Q6W7_ORYRU
MCNLRLNGSSSRAPSKATLFHQPSFQAYSTSASRLQRGSMLLRQHPQQVSSAPGRPTVVSSSNAPRIAPIRRPIDKSPLGNPTGKKILHVTVVKTVATPPSKINK